MTVHGGINQPRPYIHDCVHLEIGILRCVLGAGPLIQAADNAAGGTSDKAKGARDLENRVFPFV